MDWLALLQQIFDIVLVPVLTAATVFLVNYIRAKTNELKEQTDSDMTKKYLEMLNTTITDCVIATNQTYVEALKGQNAFTKEAQEKAFKLTYDAIMNILTEDAREYLNEALGDLNSYISNKIEAEVNNNK